MAEATKTTDHKAIRRWAEERNGKPAVVRTAGKGGILRIDFGEPEETHDPIGWDEFFQIFDDKDLAFLRQEEGESRFNKFIDRE